MRPTLPRPLPSRRPIFDRLPIVSLACVLAVAWAGCEGLGAPSLLPIEAARRTSERVALVVAESAAIVGLAVFVTRTIDRRTAVYTIAVLATTPLWFVPSKATALGMIPVATLACVLAATGIALFDERASRRLRLIAFATAPLCAIGAIAVVPTLRREVLLAASIAAVATATARLLFPALRTRHATAAREGKAGTPLCVRPGLVPIAILTLGIVGLAFSASAMGIAKTTFDAAVARAAYGLAPWSALVPFALVRRPRKPAHLALVLAAMLSLVASTVLPPSGVLVGTAVIAATVGAMLRDLDAEDRPSAALAACVFAIGALVAHDVALVPDRLTAAFASATPLPEGHAFDAARAFRIAAWIVLVSTLVALLLSRELLAIGRLRVGRGLLVVGGGLAAGLLLRAHAYPELAMRLSPGPAFHAWMARRSSAEPLALLGVDRRALTAIPQTDLVPLSDGASAVRYLDDGGTVSGASSGRRWLAIARTELPRVNAEWRARHGANVPVIAGKNGAILLASSALDAGEPSQNPLDAIVLTTAPPSLRPFSAKLGDAIEIVGWVHEPGHLKVALRVLRPSALAGHCTFLHIDHSPTRFGAEHHDHPYPQHLWREGDVIVDDFEVKLPPHFRAGSYATWFGAGVLPCHDDRRMPVTDGPHDTHDRVALGDIEVR